MKKEVYQIPEMEVIRVEMEDVITDSTDNPGNVETPEVPGGE